MVQKLKSMIQPETWGYVQEFFEKVPEAFESVPIIQDSLEKAHEQGREQGIEQGIEQGLAKGREDGERRKALEIAMRLLVDMSDEAISTLTGLSLEDVANLREQLDATN